MCALSYTQINRYMTCPFWYKLQYLDRLKTKARSYLSFGDVIHQCAEYFYKVPAPPPPSLDKLYAYYENNWRSEGYESPEQEQQYKDYGKELLKTFCEQHTPGFKMPMAVEHQFFLKIGGVILTGKIDRIDKLEDGVSIVDYKTSKDIFTVDQMETDLQLTFYQLAIESTWKMPVKKLTLYHLRSNTPFSIQGRSPEQLDEARQLVLDIAESIKNKDFPAVENSLCAFCDFPEHCPYHKHEFETESTQTLEMQDILRGRDIKDIIERYAQLQVQKKEGEEELDSLKNIITRYCEEGGYNRIYGHDHAISFKMVERSGFNEEKVRLILEPAGLWSSVLKFDSTQLRSMIENTSLNPEIRKQLEAAREIVSSSPYIRIKKLNEAD